jgi:adenylyltransferase/sulfurtransferase
MGRAALMPQQITVRELSRKMKAGEPLYLVDVRTPAEHELAALPGSVLLPLDELLQRADELSPPAGALVVTYCHHGVRSLTAAAMLEQLWEPMGQRGVASLQGGIDAWSLHIDESVPRY